MKNSVSDQSFYIESEEEEDEEKVINKHDGGDDGNESDASDSSAENQQQNKPSSYNTSWPQSYRQSIDMYSSVPSPSIGFLGTPTLSRFSSSFLSSSLTRRHTPESLSAVTKPLLPTDDQIQPQRRSSHALLPPIPSRRQSARVDDKASKVSHEFPISRHSTYGQAVLNGINVLCGVGILSTPYAAKEGGWLGLIILFTFAVLSFYTGLLLRQCLDSEPGLETYPDIGQAAFGTAGRIALSIILYAELYACCVEYIILEGDNLSSLFPNAHISLGGFELSSPRLFAVMTTIAVLPTVWLRDLSVLSYISAGGVVASILIVLCLFWVGLVDQVGFHNKGTTLNLSTLPVAVGLYGYCYSGHAVFPNIYTSMAKPNQFPSVLLACFGICSLLYAGTAIMGYTMFGEATESQFTLNMPKDLIASKIAVWTTVVNPFTKYALTMSPVAMSLEELIPSSHLKSHIYAILIRTSLVISTLIVGLTIPFFGLVMSLIGSLLTMLVTLILPPACYLSILRGKVTRIQATLCIIVIAVGVVSSAFGTYSALSKIVENLRN
ncbi:amino acid transporter AVT1C isoform X1 [Durio zibethinus]|uniref:Amino acid transporter AVT1C isoform X1 n=1 Tax=Durio zibethinus TaxID=66656 RepID=A0A6P6AKL5_DURZI|nr:amino acid transporter AVT1C isoform X1 [Durio zibethinus]XP_022765409.1 amino acid transporter AVT1C isoform X1 [Durio zibethinus]XP_022765410.1 amino acid transporter AVT1C isoform X1 [Durio zibethinus]XP_022765411.1 amino acid transporter AVT1C isoform X1 [Durio zibethinus]